MEKKTHLSWILSSSLVMAMLCALFLAPKAEAAFSAPRTFDFGAGAGEYQHTDDSSEWTETSYDKGDTHTWDYPTDTDENSLGVLRYTQEGSNGGSAALSTNFDNLGGTTGKDFTVEWKFELESLNADDSWHRAELQAFGFAVSARNDTEDDKFRVINLSDSSETTGVDLDIMVPGNVGETFRLVAEGVYDENGDIDVTGSADQWDSDNSQWSNLDTVSLNNQTPFTAQEVEMYLTKDDAASIMEVDTDTLTVVPEPSSLALLMIGAACLFTGRRRRRR